MTLYISMNAWIDEQCEIKPSRRSLTLPTDQNYTLTNVLWYDFQERMYETRSIPEIQVKEKSHWQLL